METSFLDVSFIAAIEQKIKKIRSTKSAPKLQKHTQCLHRSSGSSFSSENEVYLIS